ncbi:MAG: hypothetical protein KF747_15430 [Nitrospira sp.]|nr:hypothetical protein [Nitrospira sp.]
MAEKKAHKAKPSISLNTQWNVPDWKDTAAYPKPDDLDLTYWRWEFLRRRHDYREDFDTHATPTYEYEIARAKATSPKSKKIPVVLPDHPAFRASLEYLVHQNSEQADTAFLQALSRIARYDLGYRLPNPRCMTPAGLHFERAFGGILEGPVNERVLTVLRQDQLHVTYCLSKPLGPQEAFIQDLLRKIQKHKYGKKIGRRLRPGEWPSYLRVLDARAVGVPLHVIGKTVLKFSGTDKQIAIRVLQDIYQPAYELGINFPN